MLHFGARCSWIVAFAREFSDSRNLGIEVRMGVAHRDGYRSESAILFS
jgi:hypothetical protein